MTNLEEKRQEILREFRDRHVEERNSDPSGFKFVVTSHPVELQIFLSQALKEYGDAVNEEWEEKLSEVNLFVSFCKKYFIDDFDRSEHIQKCDFCLDRLSQINHTGKYSQLSTERPKGK